MAAVQRMGKGSVAAALKTREGWNRGGAPITEASGFNAIPAGLRYNDGEYMDLGSSTYFWETSGGYEGTGAGYWNLINARDEVMQAEDFDNMAVSVRCVKNTAPPKKAEGAANAEGALKALSATPDSAAPAGTAPAP